MKFQGVLVVVLSTLDLLSTVDLAVRSEHNGCHRQRIHRTWAHEVRQATNSWLERPGVTGGLHLRQSTSIYRHDTADAAWRGGCVDRTAVRVQSH